MPIEDLDDFEKKLDEVIEATGNELARLVRNRATTLAPFFQGILSTSIDIERVDEGWDVGTNVPYARAMEEGTKPFTPPLEPLKEWAKIQLGDESLGVAVWQSIRKKGIQAHPYLVPALEEVMKDATKIFEKHLNKIMKDFK